MARNPAAAVRALFVAHQHVHFRAERLFVELDGLFALALEKQVRLDDSLVDHNFFILVDGHGCCFIGTANGETQSLAENALARLVLSAGISNQTMPAAVFFLAVLMLFLFRSFFPPFQCHDEHATRLGHGRPAGPDGR